MVSENSSPPDEELIHATLGGDDHAFAELVRRHKGSVFRVASRFAGNAAELEDICQDVFVQAYFKLRQYRRDSPFEHWVLRITTHKCYDYLRRRRRHPGTVSVESMLESGHEPSTPEPAALAQLSAKERLVITLLELEERSVREIAGLTGWSEANVKVRAFRARASLRKLMEYQK
jgi:RNA polymerase sigma-70 factor (ECF subfamily)